MAKTKTKKGSIMNYNRIGNLFVLPFIIVFLIFNVYPVLRTLYLSFTVYPGYGTPQWCGLANYIRAFKDRFFIQSLLNTAHIWAINIFFQLGLAFILMIIFSDIRYKIKGLRVFRIVYYLPNLIACTSVAFLFKTLLDWRYGTFNQMLKWLYGLFGKPYNPIDWLGSGETAGVTIAIILSWMWFGNSFLMLMAGVQGVSKDYFEAAAIDGAGRFKIFTKITLPLIKPIMLYVTITSMIGGIQMFDLPFLMSAKSSASYDKVQTAMMYLYKFGFTTGTTQVGYASAVAYILFIIIFGFSILQFKAYGKEK